MCCTSDHDDRVVPLHSFKYIAALQHEGKGGPFFLQHHLNAGHGAGKPTSKVVIESINNVSRNRTDFNPRLLKMLINSHFTCWQPKQSIFLDSHDGFNESRFFHVVLCECTCLSYQYEFNTRTRGHRTVGDNYFACKTRD
jgi:hypothetical protein